MAHDPARNDGAFVRRMNGRAAVSRISTQIAFRRRCAVELAASTDIPASEGKSNRRGLGYGVSVPDVYLTRSTCAAHPFTLSRKSKICSHTAKPRNNPSIWQAHRSQRLHRRLARRNAERRRSPYAVAHNCRVTQFYLGIHTSSCNYGRYATAYDSMQYPYSYIRIDIAICEMLLEIGDLKRS